MAYAAVSDIEARLPYRAPFSSSTKPSTSQVQGWLDEAEAKLDAALQAVGLPAPYSSSAAIKILRIIVADYAEGRVRMAYAAAGGDGSNDDGKDLVQGFKDIIKEIRADPAWWGAQLAAGDSPQSSARIRSYVTHNDDGKTVSNGDFAPVFEREGCLGESL